MFPPCEICGDAAGRHTHKADNGETMQVCTACLMAEVSD